MPGLGFLNQFPRLILLSPFHALLSRQLLVLSFRGRKTGRRYQLPLSYLRRGSDVLMTTDGRWWRNFTGGASVTLAIAGRRLAGTARPVTEKTEVEAALRDLIAQQPSYVNFAEVKRLADGSLDVAGAAAKRVLIRVTLEPAA